MTHRSLSAAGRHAITLRFKRPITAYLVLAVGLLGAFGVGNYYPNLHLAEFSGASLVIMCGWLAVSTRMKGRDLTFVLCFVVGLTTLVLVYAYVFSARTGAPVLPSVLAQRDFAFFLLAPIVYILYLRGWNIENFQAIFMFAAVLTVINYAVLYATIDLTSWAVSGSFDQQALTTYDENRGYRLKGPLFVSLFLMLYFVRRIPKSRSIAVLMGRVAAAILPFTLLVINVPRSTVLAVAVALLLHAVFLSRPRHNLSLAFFVLVALFLGAVTMPYAIGAIADNFGEDWSYIARVESAALAWNYVEQYPILGLGQESYQSISYHDLLGEQFYPADIGLLGVAFKYGLLGVLIYVLLGVRISMGLVRLLWTSIDKGSPRRRAFLWALTVICLSFLIVAPLQTPLISGEGLGIGAIAWGLLMSHERHQRIMARMPITHTTEPHVRRPEIAHK